MKRIGLTESPEQSQRVVVLLAVEVLERSDGRVGVTTAANALVFDRWHAAVVPQVDFLNGRTKTITIAMN